MAQPKKKMAPAQPSEPSPWPFGKKNYVLFGIALAVIALGFLLLSQNDITFAPILLVVGYCVLVPWAIIAKDRTKAGVDATESRPVE
ncbi:MAG: hypothetical protein AB1644_06175 [Candidatus Zixiibacteriota bacterium]